MKTNYKLLIVILFIFASCKSTSKISDSDDGIISFTFLQINDVYEIAPLSGGAVGGMARVATLRKELERENKNTFAVLSGDFLNPSLLGTMKYNGKRIRGAQMIELMNAVEIDLAVFGNHEFDLNENDLQKRINESEFQWISTNYDQLCGDRDYPFYKEVNGSKHFIPKYYIWNISDADGTHLSIGIFGATLDTQVDYALYKDYTEHAIATVDSLRKMTDILIGVTHLNIDQDKQLANDLDGIPLIMGGHEHTNMIFDVNGTIISKADANAKTAYVHQLTYNKNSGKLMLDSDLRALDESVPLDPPTDALVQKWNVILEENLSSIVSEPFEIIYSLDKPLDAREHTIRYKQSNMGNLITGAMLWSFDDAADAAILNSGSIRIDDELSGDISPVDIFRTLPFGGSVYLVELKGSLLKGVLRYGEEAKGNGAYLQRFGLDLEEDQWKINGRSIDDHQNYWIAMNDYLMLGRDIHFLNEENSGVFNVIRPESDEEKSKRGDVRKTVIDYIKSGKFHND